MAGRTEVFLFVFSLVTVPVVLATDYVVGDQSGWTIGVNYADWVSGKTFKPGDNLTFNFDPSHSVYQLASKPDYDGCNMNSQVVRSFRSSPSTVTLDKASTTYYFVCGVSSHCQIGMKLSVTTAAADDASATPPSDEVSPPVTPTTTLPPPADAAAVSDDVPPMPPSSSPAVGMGMAGVLLGALMVGLEVLMIS